jgi:hypothetical protein
MIKAFLSILLTVTSYATYKQTVISKPAEQPQDSIKIGNKTFLIYTITASPFDPEPAIEPDNEEGTLRNNRNVKRKGKELIIIADNGKKVLMTNKPDIDTDGENYTIYTYMEYFPGIKQHVINGTYYESMDFLLVSQETGKTITTWGPPVISPDNKYFICASLDLDADMFPNGLQLYSCKNGTITAEGEIPLENWGPGQIKWLDNNTLIAEYITLDSTMNKVIKPVKLVMN